MSRRMLSLFKIHAWVMIGLSLAVMLMWFLLPVIIGVQAWNPSEDEFVTAFGRSVFFGVALLLTAQFLPLYGAVAFFWSVARKLQLEECRGFRLALCVLGMVFSAGIILWHLRNAVLLIGVSFL